MSARDLVPLPKLGQLTKTAWQPPADLTLDQWTDVGRALAKVEGSIMWWVGDWWRAGHAYGERKAVVEAEEWQGPAYETCANAASIASRVETSRRREVVPFGHHAEVAFLAPADADDLLDWCEEQVEDAGRPPTRQALRERVKERERPAARLLT